MNITELRQQYPQYNDMSDDQLADAFHSKFYSDMPKEEFYKSLGVAVPDDKGGIIKNALGAEASLADIVAPLNMAVGGLAGLGQLASGHSLDEAVKATQGFEDLKPSELIKKATGTDLSKTYGYETIQKPIELVGELGHAVGSKVADITGSPLAATIADVGTGVATLGLAGKGLSRFTQGKNIAGETKAQTAAKSILDEEAATKPVTEPPSGPGQLATYNEKTGKYEGGFVSPELRTNWSAEDANQMALPRRKGMEEDLAWQQHAEEPPVSKDEVFNQMDKKNAADMAALKEREQLLGSQGEEPIQPEQSGVSPINRGTFGQSGAIDLSAFTDAPKRILDSVKDLSDASFAHLIASITGDVTDVKTVMDEGTLTPAQRSAVVENAIKNSPNAGKFGQGGGWTPFASSKETKIPSYSDFKQQAESELGRSVSDDVAQRAYEKTYGQDSPKTTLIKAIPGMESIKNTWATQDIHNVEGAVGDALRVGHFDLDKTPNAAFRTLTSPGRLQASILRNPFVSKAVGFIKDSKDAYRVQTNNMMSDIHELFNHFENALSGGLKELGNHSWKDAADVLNLRRANERNSAFKPEDVLSGKKLELFKTIDKTLADVKDQVNARLKQLGKNPINELPYYFTSWFKGDYSIPVYKVLDDGSRRFLYNLRESDMTNARKAQEFAQQKLGEGYAVEAPNLINGSKWSDRRIDARVDFEELASLFGDTDPLVQEALQRLQEQTSVSAFGTREMPNRFKQKSGRIGSLGDRPWRTDKENYYDNKRALDMYIEGANEWLGNTNIDRYMHELQDKIPANNLTNAMSFIGDYADYVTGRRENFIKFSKETQNNITTLLNKLTFDKAGDSASVKMAIRTYTNIQTAMFIGFWSARAAIQNAVQPVATTIPRLAQLMIREGVRVNPVQLGEAFILGTVKGLSNVLGHNFDTFRHISPETLDYMEQHHIVDAHLVEQGRFKNFYTNAIYDFTANKSVALTEQMARSVAFNIYTEFFKSVGESEASAFDIAKNMTHDTMVNYESYGKSQIFGRSGMIGDVAGRLQTYKTNAFTQTYEFASDMKTKNPTTWVPFGLNMLATLATAGAIGMIGMDVIEGMWTIIQDIDRKIGKPTLAIQETSPKKFIMDNFSRKVSMGLLSDKTGLNVSGAFTQNLVNNNAMQSVLPIAGNLPDQLMAPINLMGNDVDKAKALQAITPSTLRPFIEKKFLTTPNNTVVSANTGEPIYQGTDSYLGHSNIQTIQRGETGIRRFNFNQANKNVKQSQQEVIKDTSNLVIELSKTGMTPDLKKKIADLTQTYAKLGGDPKAVAAAISKQAVQLGIGDPFVNAMVKDKKNTRELLDAQKQRKLLGK